MLKNIFKSHTNSEFKIHYTEDSHLVVSMQIILVCPKFDWNLGQYFLLQMFPKAIWRFPMTKICKLCILWESKKPIWGLTNVKRFANCCSKCPQINFGGFPWPKFVYFGGKKCPFSGLKSPPNWKNLLCSKWPQRSFGGLPWPKLAYLGGQKCHNLHSVLLKWPQTSFEGLPWPEFAKCAYLGFKNGHFMGKKSPNLQKLFFSLPWTKLAKLHFLFYLLHMPPYDFWESPMTTICIFGDQKCPWG